MPTNLTQIIAHAAVGSIPTTVARDVYTSGIVVYVDGNTGLSTNDGLSSNTPVDSVATANLIVRANKGDVVLFMPGHAETSSGASGITFSVAGVKYIALGEGNNQATFTFDTDNGSGFNITGANVTLEGLRFLVDKDGLTNIIDVAAAQCTLRNCDFLEGTAKQWVTAIDITSADAANCAIEGCRFFSATAGATSAIAISAACAKLRIVGCQIVGDYATAAIYSASIFTQAWFDRLTIRNDHAAVYGIKLTAAATGDMGTILIATDALATALDPGSMGCGNVWYELGTDQGAVRIPLGGTAEDFIGADNANNNAATPNVVTNNDGSVLERLEGVLDLLQGTGGVPTFPVAAVPADTVSLAEVIRDIWAALQGTAAGENGVQTFPSAAAPANAVSLAEGVRWLAENLLATGPGTAQDGAAGTITLAAGASASNDFYNGMLVIITGGTGVGQVRPIVDYVGATKVATVEPNWVTNPDLTSTYAILPGDTTSLVLGADNANNAFASTNVAANEDGSVLERLEQVQEAVNKGAGTALAANKSLVDALGTDGTTVTDAAVSVLGAIGADNANNAFGSTNVVANADGSVLERLEHMQSMSFPRMATKSVASIANGATSLFTFTGSIRILDIIGRVTTGIEAAATLLKLQAACDGLAAYDICANSADLTGAAAGTLLSITGTAAGAMAFTTAVGALAPLQANAVGATCITSGIIKQFSSAARTGAITWEILWQPISADATVVAA